MDWRLNAMTNTENRADCAFPDSIDPRTFMSDTDLMHLDLLQQYQALIRRKKYSEASRLLEHSGTFYYGASLFNRLENRLYRLGEYLTAKEKKENPDIIRRKHPLRTKKAYIGFPENGVIKSGIGSKYKIQIHHKYEKQDGSAIIQIHQNESQAYRKESTSLLKMSH